MKLIVGLGNPGKEYQYTRHNVGFLVIDEIAKLLNVTLDRFHLKGMYYKGKYQGADYILLKPLTYMNLSGEAIQEVIRYYKIDIQDILVIYDDLDLPLGKLRLRESGSAGGHNGIKSIVAHLKTETFNRIRIGIDKNSQIPVSDYVIGKFNKENLVEVEIAVNKARDAAIEYINKDFNYVMNRYNK